MPGPLKEPSQPTASANGVADTFEIFSFGGVAANKGDATRGTSAEDPCMQPPSLLPALASTVEMTDPGDVSTGPAAEAPMVGYEFWLAERARWIRAGASRPRDGGAAGAARSRWPDPAEYGRRGADGARDDEAEIDEERPCRAFPLGKEEVKELQIVLASTRGPYQPLGRHVPLTQVIQVAVELWSNEGTSGPPERFACWQLLMRWCAHICRGRRFVRHGDIKIRRKSRYSNLSQTAPYGDGGSPTTAAV
eukprot:NODE_4516_length_1882_cov_5.196011.p2 GENE.NODE_4516_length_1882_cov_5.196011~~NODE_4516_length_1882_cov_5.196011.p2  ORF type:complete len:250 (-),score=39.92 NODE_4516_length_1882_cov_5.196011:993-1742(-)